MKDLRVFWAVLLVVAMTWGCGSSGDGNGADVTGDGRDDDAVADSLLPDDISADGLSIDTKLSSRTVEVGDAVTVICTVLDEDGKELKVATDFLVVGTTRFEKDGKTVTFTEAGDFEIACFNANIGLQDETPAPITVTPSSVVEVDTQVDKSQVEANYLVRVTCIGLDEFGNSVPFGAALEVAPEEDAVVAKDTGDASFTFKSRTVGTYALTCMTADAAIKDPTPENVVVTSGPLDKVVTTLGAATIPAGGETTVTCSAQDKWGNVLQDADLVVEVPSVLWVQSGKVGGTKAGMYDVTCKPADGASVTLEGKKLTVTALEAAGLALKLTPSKPAYKVADQVTVGFDMVDMYGNPIPGGAIDRVVGEPEEGITQTADNRFRFEAEGKYTFSSCVVGHPDRCDDIEGWCDGTAPVLIVDYPERGLTLDGPGTLAVTGWVTEEVSELGTFTINGAPVTVNPDGSFAFPMTSVQGMNMIIAEASDVFGNTTSTMRSYYYSTTWFPQDGLPMEQTTIPRSVRAYLDDKLFFSPDPTDQGTLSSLLSDVIKNLDIKALIPSPVTTVEQLGCKYDLFITDVTFDQPQLIIRTTYGGLKLDVVIPNFLGVFQLKKVGGGFLCPGSQGGWITADSFALSSVIYISVNQTTKRFAITAGDTVVVTNNMKLNLDSWFLNLVSGLLSGTIENLLKTEMQKMIVDLINDLDDMLNELVEEGIEIPIDPLIPGMNQVVLVLALQPEKAAFDAEGGTIEINLGAFAEKKIDRSILGVIGRASCLSSTPENFELNLNNPEKVSLAASEQFVSAIAYAFWNNRGLHLHLTNETLTEMGTDLGEYGISDLNLVSGPLLPPILTSCTPGGLATIQLGDFYIDGQFIMFGKPVDVDMYLYLEVQAEFFLGIDPEDGKKKLGIQVHEPTLVEVDIDYLNDEWAGQEETFSGLIKDVALPLLLEELAEPFYIEIPAIDIAGLLGGEGEGDFEIPAKELVLDMKSLELILGYIYIKSGIQFVEPAPETP